ncbi:hypothetical protein ABID65_007723 [Bradyrhizobium sp. S3.9.2]
MPHTLAWEGPLMHEPTLTPRALLHAILGEVARKYAIAPEAIMERPVTHAPGVVQARVEVATRLLARGIPKVQIARMMKLHGNIVRVYLAGHSKEGVPS